MYVTSRPDKMASETQWLQLEQEVRLSDAAHPSQEPRVSFCLVGKYELQFISASLSNSNTSCSSSSYGCNTDASWAGAQQSCLIMLPGLWGLILVLEAVSCW